MSDVLDEVQALFSWNPPLLVDRPDNKSSSKTRPPGFYDKHFSPKLVLKRVERLPSLLRDLAGNVDNALDTALPTLPPLGPGFTTAERRKLESRNIQRKVKNEVAVANFYEQTSPKYCLSVASTLALHPAASFSEWSSLLFWTQSVSSSGYASMDGQLRFSDDIGFEEEVKLHRAAILDTLTDDILRIFEKMRDDESSLATWEIKSLRAGSGDVMLAVPNLGTFAWTTCNATNCKKLLSHRKAVEKTMKVVVGPDAQVPPWNLPTAEPPTLPPPLAEPGPSALYPSPDYEDVFSISPRTSENEGAHPTENKGQKRKRDDMSHPKDNGKKSKSGDYDDEEEYRNDDKAYQDQHDLTAQILVQEAWAQATRVDGTVIVLHSGNHELVCVRHRASQTLYVSGVIEPHACVEPGYGKLQVGIYVAAIQDAMDRKQQQRPPPVSQPGPTGDGGTLICNKDQDNTRCQGTGRKGGSGRGLQGSAGGKGPIDERLAIDVSMGDVDLPKPNRQQNMIHAANKCDVLHVYLQYGVYDSPTPATFLRSAPLVVYTRCPTPPQTTRSYIPEECLSVVLTSEIGKGATGVVHRGTLLLEIRDSAIQMDVVVKLAFDMEQRKVLRSEYEIYRHLRLKGVHQGITTELGFFDDSEDSACALVMLYAGVPLSTNSQDKVLIRDSESALSTLESIHCAGILHADIRPENILSSDLGITIIDFGHARRCDDKRAKDEELAQLRHVLGLASGCH